MFGFMNQMVKAREQQLRQEKVGYAVRNRH